MKDKDRDYILKSNTKQIERITKILKIISKEQKLILNLLRSEVGV